MTIDESSREVMEWISSSPGAGCVEDRSTVPGGRKLCSPDFFDIGDISLDGYVDGGEVDLRVVNC